MYSNKAVTDWVEEMAKLTKPDKIYWCDGSDEERQKLTDEAVSTGEVKYLNQELYPGCLFHRTAETDVARVEHLTFICTPNKEDAGPTNNWMAPDEAYAKAGAIFDGSMKGRTMYVIPYMMGPLGSPFSRVGIELTDSIYVVLNMRIMCVTGKAVMDQLGDSDYFVKGLHSKADLNPDRRYIMHFPQDYTIWSVGSGYGGNVLLGKKCFSLRIASYMAKDEGWLAEHMLILGVEDPQGNISYLAAAFPSSCGKTNLAMLIPPLAKKGYKVWTVGDDIAWMRIGEDGRLWAVNPETGFFGVVPGTNTKTNPNALIAASKNTIYTNVVEGPNGTIWWEGLDQEPPAQGINWKGNTWTPDSEELGAHPNARFTAPAAQCPCISPEWRNPKGVPISALVFGGRRARVAPLVYQSFNWEHGVFVGAGMASETTTAAAGQVGLVRRDPMAMLPFCGYNIGDYWQHWLNMGKNMSNPPKIFHVNWFRTNEKGKFLWPGFGENLRVLNWILARCEGKGEAAETPIGFVPAKGALNLDDLDVSEETMELLLSVDKEDWEKDLADQRAFFDTIGDRMPSVLLTELQATMDRFA
ncbi:MAG: phosphoenolpyruvate carboxykinase (GTP) [Peptococcaceae bacterium]|nr:phosphoenolpyruvate carboxykinase (GTP) [Peptococcaceae bacterium]